MRLVHSIPGRLRVQGDRLQNAGDLLSRLQERLEAIAGVREVRTNSLTGSVLLLFDPANVGEEALLRKVEEISGIPLSPSQEFRPPEADAGKNAGKPSPAQSIQECVQQANIGFLRLTGGSMDLRFAVPVFLAAYGTLKLLSKGPIPAIPWYALYWWSFRTFVTFNRPGR